MSTAGFYIGGHLNPAVTIAFAVGGIFSWGASGGLYHRSDSEGCRSCYCGALLLSHFKNQGEEGNSVGVFATGPAIDQHLICLEIVCDFLLHLCAR